MLCIHVLDLDLRGIEVELLRGADSRGVVVVVSSSRWTEAARLEICKESGVRLLLGLSFGIWILLPRLPVLD